MVNSLIELSPTFFCLFRCKTSAPCVPSASSLNGHDRGAVKECNGPQRSPEKAMPLGNGIGDDLMMMMDENNNDCDVADLNVNSPSKKKSRHSAAAGVAPSASDKTDKGRRSVEDEILFLSCVGLKQSLARVGKSFR